MRSKTICQECEYYQGCDSLHSARFVWDEKGGILYEIQKDRWVRCGICIDCNFELEHLMVGQDAV